MNVNFQVETDPANDLLMVTLLGFLEPTDVKLLHHGIRQALGSLRCAPGRHVAMWDIRSCKIQSQEVVGMFRSMSDERGVAARRIAMVVGGSLMRMQLPRILIDRDLRSFDDIEPAIAWLKSENGHIRSVHAAVQPAPRAATG